MALHFVHLYHEGSLLQQLLLQQSAVFPSPTHVDDKYAWKQNHRFEHYGRSSSRKNPSKWKAYIKIIGQMIQPIYEQASRRPTNCLAIGLLSIYTLPIPLVNNWHYQTNFWMPLFE